jgi:hypothetical protein
VTPALPDILSSLALTLATPLPPESSGDYAAGRVGILAMLSVLAAMEAERGPAARVWENEALRALFVRAGAAYGDIMAGAMDDTDGDRSWSALDGANASLRRRLIALHEAAEDRGDAALDGEILDLYQAMAQARRLELPAAFGG